MAQRWGIRPSALLQGSNRDFVLDAAIVAGAAKAAQQDADDEEQFRKTGITPETAALLRQRYEHYKAAEEAGISDRG